MKKFSEFKYKGEKNDYYRANAYALKCMYISFAVLFFCWILDVLNIFIVDITIMNTAAIAAAIICAGSFGYSMIVGIDKYYSCYVVMFLLVAMATVICMELAYHTTMFMMFPLICSSQYFDRKISIFTGASTCVGIAIAVLVGYRIGLCDSNMLLLTYTDSAEHMAELLSGEFTVNTDVKLMFLFFVFPRWLIVLAMMPLLNHIAKDIQARTAREVMARHLAEVDGLTGIYNRTKYLQEISGYYPTCSQVAVMFFDINNLKQLNDTKGHEYGDILIRGLADGIASFENEKCKCFRLGGDEFVMILDGAAAEAESAERFCEKVKASLQGKKLEEGIELSVAVGLASGKGKSIEKLVKAADENMYQNKQEMKNAQ